ncbi:unnamed protein product [Acanthoscelides obtectus]|uniref:G kinase-anchoring protein 1 n=1 Tax=Acanthoscelides obtectus TaxID=200917 RepID=A0A9P0NPK4_ACAOB|nr:unnamed protein product [Acanthoscelides obtectus]CAK1624964.1 G kinase-anchoring protein 1 [Acanthoscelides obtectus]
MDIAVPSRFSCLKIEDDEFKTVGSRQNAQHAAKKKVDSKPQSTKKTLNQNNSTKKSNQKQSTQQNGPSKKSKSKSKSEHNKQWEDWKKKDDEFVNENFEQDLQCAILQSKLDFETQKKNSVSVIMTTQDKNKKKKTKTMSLDQFLDNSPNKDKETSKLQDDTNFFENAISSAKEEVKKERVEEKRRQRANNIEEIITLAQCQEKLQKEKQINEELRKELEDAKKEITMVKKRNKTLCSMLSQGEMKDKAAVLLELEKLTTMKEELTEEVARLHKLLEQERSLKNHVSSESHSNTKHKEKHTKK